MDLKRITDAARIESDFVRAVVNMDHRQASALHLGDARAYLIDAGAAADPTAIDFGDDPVNLEARLDGFVDYWRFSQLRDQLAGEDKPKRITMRINSPGGLAWSGYAMYNLLREYASAGTEVVTIAAGRVGSAASLVYMAGDKRQMPKNLATIMFHEASSLFLSVGMGPARKLRNLDPASELAKSVQTLESIDDAIAEMLADRSKMSKKRAAAYLEEERYENPKEALKLGFATEILEDAPPVNPPVEPTPEPPPENPGEHFKPESKATNTDESREGAGQAFAMALELAE